MSGTLQDLYDRINLEIETHWGYVEGHRAIIFECITQYRLLEQAKKDYILGGWDLQWRQVSNGIFRIVLS